MANTKIQKEFLDDELVAELTTTYTSDAAPAPTGNAKRNTMFVTALATNPTVGAPTGTPAAGNMIRLVITATGSTRTVSYNAALTAGNITRTTSIPSGSTLCQIYSYINGAWKCQFDDITT